MIAIYEQRIVHDIAGQKIMLITLNMWFALCAINPKLDFWPAIEGSPEQEICL